MAEDSCDTCKKTPAQLGTPLLRCARCKIAQYCTAACQKASWKIHKSHCIPVEHSSTYQDKQYAPLSAHIAHPYSRIDNGTYLHDRPERDVFTLLVDAFRMRQADEFKFAGRAQLGSLYAGGTSSAGPFRRFLEVIESENRAMLPPWWSADMAEKCVAFGEPGGEWCSLRKKVDKEAVIKHYGDDRMPMQLRMFAEEALGEPAPGTMPGQGKQMRAMMMTMEKGGSEDGRQWSMTNIG